MATPPTSADLDWSSEMRIYILIAKNSFIVCSLLVQLIYSAYADYVSRWSVSNCIEKCITYYLVLFWNAFFNPSIELHRISRMEKNETAITGQTLKTNRMEFSIKLITRQQQMRTGTGISLNANAIPATTVTKTNNNCIQTKMHFY